MHIMSAQKAGTPRDGIYKENIVLLSKKFETSEFLSLVDASTYFLLWRFCGSLLYRVLLIPFVTSWCWIWWFVYWRKTHGSADKRARPRLDDISTIVASKSNSNLFRVQYFFSFLDIIFKPCERASLRARRLQNLLLGLMMILCSLSNYEHDAKIILLFSIMGSILFVALRNA